MRVSPLVAVALVLVSACADSPAPLEPDFGLGAGSPSSRLVVSDADAGPGSFRSALEEANADPSIATLVISPTVDRIVLAQSLRFAGAQALEIDGNGAVIEGQLLPAGAAGLLADGGGDLRIRQLTVTRAPGVGIAVLVPATAAGTQQVVLHDISLLTNGSHGLLVNDQADFLTDPETTSPLGSDASLEVTIRGGRFEGNGFTAIDQDGIRINEGGLGSLRADISHTQVLGNGGDGIELDERGEGHAVFDVRHTVVNANGPFTALDYDDGMDVDEAGPGDIIGRFLQVLASDNFEQGLDLNENDAGNLRLEATQVTARDNAEEGIELEEDDDFAGGGDIVARFTDITATGNGAEDGDAGFKVREKGDGNVDVIVTNITADDNAIGGILIREDAAGNLRADLTGARASRNGGHGVSVDENSLGDLVTELRGAITADNQGAGVAADQAPTGTGTLLLRALRAVGNSGGSVVTNAGISVDQQP